MQLYIDTYGAYLHTHDGMFEIIIRKNDSVVKKKLVAKKISTIVLSLGVSVSSDAVNLALINNIDIIFLEMDGTPLGRVWHSKLGSTTKIRKTQLIASLNKVAVECVKGWITAKINNQIDFIKYLKKHRADKSDFLNDRLGRLEVSRKSLCALEADNIKEISEQIRGFEGTAGRLYFETLSFCLSKEYRFESRSSRPARDPFNAFLNYAYGVLYSKVEKALILAGIDPYLGFLHRDDYNQMSMVFDFIEPFRIYADETVFRLFSAKKVNQGHTDKIVNGYSLNKDGKLLLMEAFNNHMDDDPVRYKGRNQLRSSIIQLEAHSFANKLIGKKTDEKELERIDLEADF